MGGNASGTEAVRLSEAQHSTLQTRLRSLLDAEGFETAIAPAPLKESHGDVDLLIGSEESFQGRAGGTAGMKLEELAETLVALSIEEKHRKAGEGTDAWCAALCRHLGAERWLRNGDVLSLAIPTATLGDLLSTNAGCTLPAELADSRLENRKADFVQADLIFVPGSMVWAQMAHSFGHARHLLTRLVRAATASNNFVVHTGGVNGLTLRFAAPVGLRSLRCPGLRQSPTTEVELTSDTGALCEWLGLEDYDAEKLAAGEYDCETAMEMNSSGDGKSNLDRLYGWLGSGSATSLAAIGYERLVRQWHASAAQRQARAQKLPSKRQQRFREEDEAADGFCEWLEGRGWGEGEYESGKTAGEAAALEFFGWAR